MLARGTCRVLSCAPLLFSPKPTAVRGMFSHSRLFHSSTPLHANPEKPHQQHPQHQHQHQQNQQQNQQHQHQQLQTQQFNPNNSTALQNTQRKRRQGQEHMRRPYPFKKRDLELPKATSECWGVCLGERFEWKKLGDFLIQHYQQVNFVSTGLIHIPLEGNKHIFAFEEGCLAFWSFSEDEQKPICASIKPYIVDPLVEIEVEEMPPSLLREDVFIVGSQQPEKDIVLDMIAFSNALLRSVQLSVYEAQADEVVMSMKDIIDQLSANGKITAEEHFLNKSLGALLRTRSYINLFTSITETPDSYWDDRKREELWKKISAYLDINSRVAKVNKKIEFAKDAIEIVKEDVNEQKSRRFEAKSTKMEWLIIILIAIEVVFGTPNFMREIAQAAHWSQNDEP